MTAAAGTVHAQVEQGRITVQHVTDNDGNEHTTIRWTCHNCGNPRGLTHVLERPSEDTASTATDPIPCKKTPEGKTPDGKCDFVNYGKADLQTLLGAYTAADPVIPILNFGGRPKNDAPAP